MSLATQSTRSLECRPDVLGRVALVIYHRDGGEIVQLQPGTDVVIGREPPADVVVNDRSVSRQHARFSWREGVIAVHDLGSTNGTLLRGSAITEAFLTPGDEVEIGAVTVTVQQLIGGARAPHGLASHERFVALLEAEVARAGYFARPFTLVMMRATQEPLRFWAPRARARLRPADALAVYSDDVLEIMLPETSQAEALEIVRAVLADASVALRMGVASFPLAATSAEGLVGAAWRALTRASEEQPLLMAPSKGTRTWTPDADSQGPICSGEAMRALFETASRVARSSIPVLVLGETGTGKEVLARFVHERGPRRDKPMVCVNCAGIPAALLESALFGHEKGAFTGATAQQPGVFEAAHGGTVFLDEIGELSAPAQAALLRVLETKRLTRVGSTREIAIDVRVVAATHRDLDAMAVEGLFREDLLYRLNTVTLKVPPLRQRPEEVPLLAARFLEEANRENGAAIAAIDPHALELLAAYSWPGNVRELRNAIERAVVLARGDILFARDLPERVQAVAPAQRPAPSEGSTQHEHEFVDVAALTGDYRARMNRLEAALLRHALNDATWNKAETARRLGMPLRTLVHRVKNLGLQRPARAMREEYEADD